MQRLCCSSAAAQLTTKQLDQLYCMTSYLTEVALLEYQLLPMLPSELAAAAYAYSHVLLGLPLDVQQLEQLTQHSAADLSRPMEYLCALQATLHGALQLGRPYAVTVKYCDEQVCRVGAVPPIMSLADARAKDWCVAGSAGLTVLTWQC